jgi:hypothetical protein
MKLRNDIPMPQGKKPRGFARAIFDAAKHGDSVHVKTAGEAISLYSNFMKSGMAHRKHMRITRHAVGNEDPEGPGYRMFFISLPGEPPSAPPKTENVWG